MIVLIYSVTLLLLGGGGGNFAGKLFTNVSEVLVTIFSNFHLLVNFIAVYIQFINGVRTCPPCS